MNIRVAITDDEPLAIELLADYVQKTPGLQLTEATTDVFKVLQLVQQGAVDLVLLDVQMPQLTGIQFMQMAANKCSIILTTAYTDYALDGYEYNVEDYLLKPISYERFYRAIQKVKQRHEHITPNTTVPAHIFVKSEYRLVRIALSDIRYIEGLRDYIAIHTTTQKILSLESMTNMENILPPDRFIRIHRSYIIALEQVQYIEKGMVHINGQSLPVGNSYKEAFDRVVGKR